MFQHHPNNEATVGIPTQRKAIMFFQRTILNHATATSPELTTHKERPIPTFFTDLSKALGEEITESIWLKQWDVAHALIDFHRRANDEPLNDTIATPLIIEREGQTITFGISHTSRENRNVWGTNRADIDGTEYCVECEQRVGRGHYDNCPNKPASV